MHRVEVLPDNRFRSACTTLGEQARVAAGRGPRYAKQRMRCTTFGIAAGVILATGACQRSLDGAACPCAATDECCFELDRCHPKGECPQPTWRGPWTTAPADQIAPRPCGPLIDDFEDNTGVICLDEGRVGSWYSFNDGKGRQFPASSEGPIKPSLEPGSSNYALHTDYSHDASAESQDALVALVGVDLQYNGKKYGHYDASRYNGISFLARGSSKSVKVRVNTVESTYVDFAGTCRDACTPWSVPIEVTDTWQRFDVRFDTLTRDVDAPSSVDTKTLTNIQFQFVNSYTKEVVDLWVDDLTFLSPPE